MKDAAHITFVVLMLLFAAVILFLGLYKEYLQFKAMIKYIGS